MSGSVQRIDVSGTSCPMTFVRVKVALEGLRPGDILEAVLNDGEHPREIPPSVEADGHEVLSMDPIEHKVVIRIRKGAERRDAD